MDKLRVSTAIVVLAFLFPTGGGMSAKQQTEILPISAYLDAIDFSWLAVWSDPVNGDWLYIDMYGKRAEFFGLNVGTSVTGQVTIKDLGDGTERVTVDIHSSNAICWGFNGSGEPAFGYSARQVSNHVGSPSLGDALTTMIFTQPVGPLDVTSPLESIKTAVMCHGELRYGSGQPDGTPGFAKTTQIGLWSTGVPSGCPPEQQGNCFPAEKVQFQPTGR